ncbi:methyltransferase domain-containing protein [Avibacterium avium]|uniref:class I SAM-dependent methyltransferase n=1 Tax=Avibacterium avium TaxID=751 RepID=UPI003BF7D69D
MSKYDFNLDLTSRNSLSVIVSRIKPHSTVLEFGPAHGRMTKYLKEQLGCIVYAVELDTEAAKDSSTYTKKIVVGNIEDYQWKKELNGIQFNYIVFADVLEHLYYPDRVLESVKDFLMDDGSILVSVPNISHGSILIDLLNNKFNYNPTGLLDNTHIRFFTSNTFKEMLSRLGYHIAYETAIYVQPKYTEFQNSYDIFPTQVVNYLRGLSFLDAYQLVFEFKKQVCHKKVELSEKFSGNFAQLFVDSGDGFNAVDVITIPVLRDLECQDFEFSLEGFRSIRQLRFDPFDDCCAIRVQKIKIILTTEEEVDLQNMLHINSDFNKEGIYFFSEDDPQIVINKDWSDQSIQKFVVSICYLRRFSSVLECYAERVLDRETVLKEQESALKEQESALKEQESALKEQESTLKQYEVELSVVHKEIQSLRNSLSWRITKPLRKVKEIFSRR